MSYSVGDSDLEILPPTYVPLYELAEKAVYVSSDNQLIAAVSSGMLSSFLSLGICIPQCCKSCLSQ